MEPTMTSALQASLALRATIGRLRRRLREVASSDELTPSQVAVLTRLGKEVASTASVLATAEGVRPQSMASTLSALEQLGLIRRSPDPTDGRRQIVTLTGTGKALDRDNQQARREWLTRAMHERFSEDERRLLIEAMALLERLTDQ